MYGGWGRRCKREPGCPATFARRTSGAILPGSAGRNMRRKSAPFWNSLRHGCFNVIFDQFQLSFPAKPRRMPSFLGSRPLPAHRTSHRDRRDRLANVECSGFHAEPCFQYGVCHAGTIGHTERFRSMRTVRKRTDLEGPSTRRHVSGCSRVKCRSFRISFDQCCKPTLD